MAAHVAQASGTGLTDGRERSAATITHPAALAKICVRPPSPTACWRVPLPTCHDSASRRRWWPRGTARMHPGCVNKLLNNQPAHRCRHGSGGAGETRGHGVLADPHTRDLRRNGAAMTCTILLPCCTSNRSPLLLSGAGRRDPWRRRWAGWRQRDAPVVLAHREGSDRWRSDMSVTPGWVSVSDAARYVKLAPDVITRAIASGELFAVIKPVTRREGGKPQYRVALSDVDAWMRSQPSAKEAMCGV